MALWVPKTRDDPPKWRCRLCGSTFHEHRHLEQHVVGCIHGPEGMAAQEQSRINQEFHKPSWRDEEYEAWVAVHKRLY